MNDSPKLIAILVKYENTNSWILFHIAEIYLVDEIRAYLTHLRMLARKNNTNEKYKIELYEPSD